MRITNLNEVECQFKEWHIPINGEIIRIKNQEKCKNYAIVIVYDFPEQWNYCEEHLNKAWIKYTPPVEWKRRVK